MLINHSIRMEEIMFVFKLILYTLVGVTNDKIAQIVQYCLKSGRHTRCAMLVALRYLPSGDDFLVNVLVSDSKT